jgi:hypothetical protein
VVSDAWGDSMARIKIHHRYLGAAGEIVCANTNNQAQMFSLILCIAAEM